MKKIIGFLSLLISFYLINGQSAKFEWADKIGGIYSDIGYSLATDASGNTYTVGSFTGKADFDPSTDTFFNTSTGAKDIFITKLNSAGNFVWAKRIGGTFDDEAYYVTLDSKGNIFMTGSFSGTVDFNPGSGVFNLGSGTNRNMFILKLDTSGNFKWAAIVGGSGYCGGNSITIDEQSNIYSVGYFYGTVDFDPGSGVFNLNSPSEEAFFLKLDSSGNFGWAKSIGSTLYDAAISVAVDNRGHVYATGYFMGMVDFDPGTPAYYLFSHGQEDAFILKLDTAGNFIWANNMGGNLQDVGFCIRVDAAGSIYTIGKFRNTCYFNLSNVVSAGDDDILISKIDSSGNLKWMKRAGGQFQDLARSLAIDASANLYLTGFFRGTVDFDPGPGSYNLTSAGVKDVFVLKLDSSGSFAWAKGMGGGMDDIGYAIALDSSLNIYTTGYYQLTGDYDPGSNIYYLNNIGADDVFVHKLGNCSPTAYAFSTVACDTYSLNGAIYTLTGDYVQYLENTTGCDSIIKIHLTIKHASFSSMTATNCDSFTTNGITYKSSGVYKQKITNAVGCDSTITINLTIKYSTMSAISQTSCDSFILNGSKYATSGIYTQHLTNAKGCDSIITLNLTIKNSTSALITKTSCDSYTLNGVSYTSSGMYTQTRVNAAGCDSTIILNLTVNHFTSSSMVQAACDSFSINNQTYKASGIYLQTLVNTAGCDSILTINLTVNKVNTLVTRSGNILTAGGIGATYQWLTCPSYAIIPGATNQNYTATGNGDYAVIVSQSGCKDTSDCYSITGLGIDDHLPSNTLQVFPNPSNGIVVLSFSKQANPITIEVFNSTGNLVYSQRSMKERNEIDLSHCANGLYLIKITDANNKSLSGKVIKF